MSVRGVLIQARAFIARGWCQKQSIKFEKGVVCYCTTQAITMAVTGWDLPGRDDIRIRDAAYVHLRRTIGGDKWADVGLVRWNDAPERTQQEILAKFDEAINSLPEEEREDATVCS